MKDRRLFFILLILITIFTVGTIGYQVVQPEYTFLDSLYMTVITITTIGYSEIKPLTSAGRIFNMALIGMGWLGIFLIARFTGQMLIEGEIVKVFGRRKMNKQLAAISDHYIVCGYGRVGRVVCNEFLKHHMPFVVIERGAEALKELSERGILNVSGDCTQDQILLSPGIERAKGLINAIANEADAVYTTLSARQYNPNIFIMARADSPGSEQMLKRAGANRVISPQASAGLRMATAALRPSIVDFITIEVPGDETGARVEEVEVLSNSALIGRSFKDVDFRAKYGLNIIGVKKPDGLIIYNPTADYKVQYGDTLIIFGSEEQLGRVDELFEGAHEPLAEKGR
jgi:voltage-gated potassium channel